MIGHPLYCIDNFHICQHFAFTWLRRLGEGIKSDPVTWLFAWDTRGILLIPFEHLFILHNIPFGQRVSLLLVSYFWRLFIL